MGRSRRVLFVVAFAALPVLAACNAILGIDDFKRTECGVNPCDFDGGDDQFVPDNFVPDSGKDANADAPPGVGPVSWAAFPMPNYSLDSGLGDAAPRPLTYTVGGGIVTDFYTKLPWRDGVIGGGPDGGLGTPLTYAQARQACAPLPGGPWRLPKRIELVTLLSYGHPKPFIDQGAFKNFPAAATVWTSSEVRTASGVNADTYWAVDFGTGSLVQLDDAPTVGAMVLCVKDKP